jgi:putative hydroxymethylpyrimidine transport system substrate-binding protein
MHRQHEHRQTKHRQTKHRQTKHRQHIVRRIALAVVMATAAALAVACGSDSGQSSDQAAQELTKVTFTLKFPMAAPAANLVASDKLGYFRDEGLEVKFITPSTPADSGKLVASGAAQFGTVDGMDILLARDHGVPIISIATTHQYGVSGILAPAKLNVTSPKQLEGHTVGITGIPGQRAMLQSVLTKAGVQAGKVRIVEIGFTGTQALTSGKVDLLGDGIYWSDPIRYNLATGKPADDTATVTFLRFDEWGAPRFYTNGVATSERYLKEHPDTVRAFLKAFTRGLAWSLDHPQEAIDMLMKDYPTNDRALSDEMLRRIIPVTRSPETESHGLGWQDPAAWETLAQFFHDQGLTKSTISVSEAMTNTYLPQPQ